MIFRAHCCIAFHARKTVSLPCDYFFVPNVPHGGATLCGQLHSCSIESKTKPVKKKVLISILNTKVNKTWLIRNQECENTSERFRITPWLLQILYCNFFFFFGIWLKYDIVIWWRLSLARVTIVVSKEGTAMTSVVGCTIGVNVRIALVWKVRTVLPMSAGSGYVVRTLIKKKIRKLQCNG